MIQCGIIRYIIVYDYGVNFYFGVFKIMFSIVSRFLTSTSMGSLGVNSQDGQKSVTQKSVTQKPVTPEISISRRSRSVSPNDVEKFLDELLRESNNKEEDLQTLLSIIKNPEAPIKRLQLKKKPCGKDLTEFLTEDLTELLTKVLKSKCFRKVVEKRCASLLGNKSEIKRGSQFVERPEVNNA
jgi:hypothetical protein